jgi:hypothetical protein
MAIPLMGSDTTSIDRPGGAWPLTRASSIHEARGHLRSTGERAAVVFRSDRPVGVVTAAALARAPDASAPIATVMDHVTVPVNQSANAGETVRTFLRTASDWLRQRPRTSRARAA